MLSGRQSRFAAEGTGLSPPRADVIEHGQARREDGYERPDGLTLKGLVDEGRIGAAYLVSEAAFR